MRVNVESEAMRDVRFGVLAASLPAPDAIRMGIALMLPVWEWCTRQGVHTVKADHLALLLGSPDAAALLVASGLGEEVEGGVRIKGAAGRVDWFMNHQQGSAAGGRARAAAAARSAGRFTSAHQPTPGEALVSPAPGVAPGVSSAPAPAPTPDLRDLDHLSGSPAGEEEPDPTSQRARDVLATFNEVTDRDFRPTPATLRPILGRLGEGYTDADLLLVARDRARRWKDDPKMRTYLRPATIYGAEKFPGYLEDAAEGAAPAPATSPTLARILEAERNRGGAA